MKTKLLAILFLIGVAITHAAAQKPEFWDGIEAFDGPTDKNPILASQIDFYFNQLVSPLPDSITLEISRLVNRTENNSDLRDFILWHLLEKYQHPEYMTHDQVFIWLYDTYFSQLKIKNLNEQNLALIHDKVERLRQLTLFSIAPVINIKDIDLQSVENDYIVLFFYDHDCALCHQEMHDLDSVCARHPEMTALKIDMNDNADGLDELYSLYDIETTPLIYVLDRDKRIIAKKIRAKQIPLILQ